MAHEIQASDGRYQRRRRIVRRLIVGLWLGVLALWIGGWMYLQRDRNGGGIGEQQFAEPSAAQPDRAESLQTLGGLEFVRCDPERGFRPLAAISCAGVWTENGQLGVFQTALHKELTLDKPSLRLYEYSDAAAAGGGEGGGAAADAAGGMSNFTGFITEAFTAMWSDAKTRLRSESIIDVSNTTQVFLRDFSCTWHRDGAETLRLQCRRAQLSWKKPDVLELRGHVFLRSAEGRQIECHRAQWLLSSRCFSIEGKYIIQENGAIHSAARGQWDYSLAPVSAENQTLAATAAATTITESTIFPSARAEHGRQ